ncbi:MAG: hypothetical protein DRH24_14270 [Deltaproteobacteria bacterium]|nr:MAG: hypothetical protein DRH24_14270 [Deltaproteobacteria bacterium]
MVTLTEIFERVYKAGAFSPETAIELPELANDPELQQRARALMALPRLIHVGGNRYYMSQLSREAMEGGASLARRLREKHR